MKLIKTSSLSSFYFRIGRFLDWRSYNRLIAPHFEARGKIPPSFEQLRYNASLVLGNSHVSMGEAKRLPQNYINIGGYHIDEKTKPLSDVRVLSDSFIVKLRIVYGHQAFIPPDGRLLRSKSITPIQARYIGRVWIGTINRSINSIFRWDRCSND